MERNAHVIAETKRDLRKMLLAATMPAVAAVILLLTAGVIFAQQAGEHGSAQIPIAYIAAACTAMGTACATCAGGCWWLLKRHAATLEKAKEREEYLVDEMKEEEKRHAQELSDAIREVMPPMIKLTELVPTQQKLIQTLTDLVQELSKRRLEGEVRRP